MRPLVCPHRAWCWSGSESWPCPYLDGNGVWIIILYPYAVVIAERCLRLVSRRFDRFTADFNLGCLTADERVLDHSVWPRVGRASELLTPLEDFLPCPQVYCKGNEDDKPEPYLMISLCSLEDSFVESYQTGP